MKNKVHVVLQARTGSSRLYGKVLLPILGVPLVVLCWRRLKLSNLDVVVIIPKGSEDDFLAKILKKNKIKYFRGSSKNVLKRFQNYSKKLKSEDIIVRVTADNPFVDGFFLKKILSIYLKKKLNYFSSHENIKSIPYGMQAEIFRVKHLREIKKKTNYICEHVTPSIKKKYLFRKFKINLNIPKKLSNLRLTIDYIKDFKRIEKIFNVSKKNLYINFFKILKKNENKKKNKRLKKKSQLILGTVQLGLKYYDEKIKINQKRASNILTTANSKKINYLDTASTYGMSEKFIGNIVKNNKFSFYISSKLKDLKISNKVNDSTLIKKINDNIFNSLINLNTYYLDDLLVHNCENIFKSKTLYLHLKKFLRCGIIKNIGASIYTPEEFYKLKKYKIIKTIQFPFNILDYRWLNILANKNNNSPRLFARSILMRGNIRKNNIIFNKNNTQSKKLTKKLLVISKEYQKKDLIDLSISYVKSFKEIDYFVIGVQNTAQLLEITDYFKNKKLNNTQKFNIIELVKKTYNAKNSDLRNWH